jgi:hypothetical protein
MGTDLALAGFPSRQRSTQMAKDAKTLQAGFTGSPVEKEDGIKGRAKSAAALVKSEADAVGAAAVDHPHMTSTVLIGISALAFGLGYLLGQSSADNRRRYWR